MQETVCTAGELFLATHQGFHRQALLPAKARDEGMSAGELLFDKLPGTDDSANEASKWEVQTPMNQALQDVQQDAQAVWLSMSDPALWQCPGTPQPPEALERIHEGRLWDNDEYTLQAKSKVMMERLQPLSEEATQAACSQWLSQTAGGAQGAILRLLQACRDASELAAAEARLRAAVQDWKRRPQADSLRASGARPDPCFGRPRLKRLPSLLSRLHKGMSALRTPAWSKAVLQSLALKAYKLP